MLVPNYPIHDLSLGGLAFVLHGNEFEALWSGISTSDIKLLGGH